MADAERFSSHDDSVYGGSMSQGEFYCAEFQIEEDMPNWFVEQDGKVFRMRLNNQQMELRYDNCIIYEFDEPYDWFSHLYIIRENQKPLYVLLPEDEEGREAFDNLLGEMIIAGFKFRTQAVPEVVDFETMYKRSRGDESIEDIIGKILVEGASDE